MTTNEWWVVYQENKDDLLRIIAEYHPCYIIIHKDHRHLITAPAAEKLCQEVRAEIKKSGIAPLEILEKCEKDRSAENTGIAVQILNEAWFGLPESMSSREVPGFFVLCDLCSEWDRGEDEIEETET